MKNNLTARRMREALTKNNLTAQELSNKTGIGKSSISGYVNGSHVPGNKAAYAMAKVLNVKPEWLMGFDVDEPETDYYLNQDAADLAGFLLDNPEYKVLFDASRKVKAEDIRKALKAINIFTEE